jgi:hypothetical protein
MFSVGTKLMFIDPVYNGVSAVSADGLALFVSKSNGGTVFTRNSLSAEFSNPNGSNPPPQLEGWMHKPGRGCVLFATKDGPAGCQNDDLWKYSH